MAHNRNGSEIEREIYERQSRICKAFAHPIRLRLLDLLGQRARTAADLQEQLGITKANLSQHLAILRSAGAISARRDGRHLACSLAIPEIKEACHLIRRVLRAQIRNGRRMEV
jgi:DNA-binding transcriptional ArsR family regulator